MDVLSAIASEPIKFLLLIITLILSFIYVYVSWNYDFWKKRGVPYEKPVFIFGNLGFLMRKSFWDFCIDLAKKHKDRDYVGIFLGRQPALMVQTPELARRVLVKDFEYFEDRYIYSGHSDPLGSLNIFTVKNPIWAEVRRELTPLFTPARLRQLTELMNLNGQQLVRKVNKEHIVEKKQANLKELFSMYASDTVGYTVFGLRVSALSGQDSPLWYITNNMIKWTFWRGFEFTMIFFMPAVASFMRLQFFSRAATDFIKKIFWSVVDERTKTGTHNEKDLVSHLLRLKDNMKLPTEGDKELSENLMMAQVAVFILGSVETSSTTLSYCLHELAHHPEVQDKLYQEVKQAMETTGKEILNYDDLLELRFLSSCLYETLRKYPTLGYIDRICNKEYKLDDKTTIPVGTPVFVNVMALQHNEKYYPDHLKWKPERFSGAYDENNNFTFLPFGEGPRFCIGKRLGMSQMRAALAQIIVNFRLEPGPVPYKVEADPYSVILAPKNGGCVQFCPRT